MTQKNNDQIIRETAYYMWLDAGKPMGQPDAFWYQAVMKVNGHNKNPKRLFNRRHSKVR